MQRIPLKDIKNNTVVEVSIDEVPELVGSGQYALPKNATLPVLNPQGELGDISSTDYLQALQNGYAPARSEDIQKAIDVEQFGDSPLQTGLERAASAATFGATDFIASQLEPHYAENMRKREELNPAAAITGEIVGTVAPALLSGGTSLAGKVASKSAPAIAARVGETFAAGTAKQIAKVLPKNALAAKVIEKIVPRTVGMGVEGALYGAGNYISDASLGNADWSAESLISNVGMSGLLGAGIGGALGGVQVLGAPILKKVTGLGDVEKIATEFTGSNTARGSKIFDKGIKAGEMADVLVNAEKVGIKVTDDAEAILSKFDDFLERTGTKIDDTLTTMGEAGEKVLPRADKLKNSLLGRLSELKKAATTVEGSAVTGAKPLITAIDDITEQINGQFANRTAEKVSVQELQQTRQFLDKGAKFDRNNPGNLSSEIYRDLRTVLRAEIDEVSQKVGGETAAALKAANRDYFVGMNMLPGLEKQVFSNAKKQSVNLRDIMLGSVLGYGTGAPAIVTAMLGAKKLAESQMGKNAQLIYAVKLAEQKTEQQISKTLRNFFLETGKGAKATTLRLSTDAKEYDAYTKKVSEYANNPDAYLETLARRNIAANQQLPTVTGAAQAKSAAAMQYLALKMPKQASSPTLISRPYVPSSQERAKFMRHAEIVENPKKALEHFQNGTLTKENVDALKAVYPEFYKKLVGSATEFITKHGGTLPYSKKMQLGLLLGIPTDSSLRPEFINRLQTGYVQSQEQGAIEPGITGLSKLNKSGRISGQEPE